MSPEVKITRNPDLVNNRKNIIQKYGRISVQKTKQNYFLFIALRLSKTVRKTDDSRLVLPTGDASID